MSLLLLSTVKSASVAEVAAAQDALGATLLRLADVTEAATAAEIVSAAALLQAQLTEAATAGETIDAVATFPAAITEAATAQDVLDAILSLSADLTEAATADETISAKVEGGGAAAPFAAPNIQVPNSHPLVSIVHGGRAVLNHAWAVFFSTAADLLWAKTRSGATAERPTSAFAIRWTGLTYFDTELGKPVFLKDAATWISASGAPV